MSRLTATDDGPVTTHDQPDGTSLEMLSSRFRPWHVPLFLAKYAWLGVTRRPVLVHFEVTMRCNARCGFCDYWKTPAVARETETERCAGAARFFNPMLVTFTGGEPLLRKDLEDLVAAVRDAIRLKYITLITHGETCCIAANVDPAAITEPQRFTRAGAGGRHQIGRAHV